jgi:cation:H+ antiporter
MVGRSGAEGGMDVFAGVALFAVGAALAIFATERLLEGLVGLALLIGLSTFVVGALLSGLEAENIAVGVVAGHARVSALALGSVFGGATFLVCVALGLGGVIAPLEVRLPRSFLLLGGAAPLVIGLALVGQTTPRVAGAVLLLAFGVAMAYLVLMSRGQPLLESEEVAEAQEEHRGTLAVIGLTIFGLVAISVGAELITEGAKRLVAHVGIPALVMGMVITPGVIEIDEVIRQAVPAGKGHPEVSAGNLLGTLLYFTLCNLVVHPASLIHDGASLCGGAPWRSGCVR